MTYLNRSKDIQDFWESSHGIIIEENTCEDNSFPFEVADEVKTKKDIDLICSSSNGKSIFLDSITKDENKNGLTYLQQRFSHNSNEFGFNLLKTHSKKDYNECMRCLKGMIERGRNFNNYIEDVELSVIMSGLFADRNLYLVKAKCDKNEDSFLFYKSHKGSGEKEKGKYYPIPGFLVYESFDVYNEYYLPNGWFIKKMKEIVDLYHVKLFKKIQSYLKDTIISV